MYRFECFTPKTVGEAVSYLADHGDEARPIAGGTALLILMKTRILMPRRLVNLKSLKDLEYIQLDGDGFRIGAMTTHRALTRSEVLRLRLPLLAECAQHVANSRIRNVATLGGNLCHAEAASDPPAALLALEAEVKIRGPDGERTAPISDFFVDYYETVCKADEMVTEIRVPVMAPHTAGAYESFTGRSQEDKPVVSCAAILTLSGKNGTIEKARVALGAVSSTPIRVRAAEDLLRGKILTDDLTAEVEAAAVAATDPVSDVRGSADFKREICRVMVRRAVRTAYVRAGRA